MKNNFDIVVIGAGPAGSALAEKTAMAGFKTLILEKEKLPGDKPCAGIAPPRIYRLLGKIPEYVTERKFKGYHLFSPSGIELYTGFLKEGVIVDRKKFDHWLIERAKDAGAEVADNLKADNIVFSKNDNKIKTNNNFYSKILVGADGANSFVRKTIGREYKNFALGVQYTIDLPDEVINEKIGNWFEVHYGNMNWGYGWVSPQNNKIKIGLGSTDDKFKKNSREYLNKFVENFRKKKEIKNLKTINFTSHLIPIDGPLDKPCRSNVVLIGDAAGFVNPLTGEGIYYAVKSAQIAADAIIRHSCDPEKDDFEKECNEKLKNIKLNTKLRDEVLQNNDSMEKYIKRMKKLE
ncbi:MAG: hypothetical protein CVU81_00050 [Euryarchaeota archaeon HGW-Euryarchaeota-1]|nr:MAG: hypothetical protein CVU81_00050 [Euryarchaeota archaeon HGW-Euryarchaeota-1]